MATPMSHEASSSGRGGQMALIDLTRTDTVDLTGSPSPPRPGQLSGQLRAPPRRPILALQPTSTRRRTPAGQLTRTRQYLHDIQALPTSTFEEVTRAVVSYPHFSAAKKGEMLQDLAMVLSPGTHQYADKSSPLVSPLLQDNVSTPTRIKPEVHDSAPTRIKPEVHNGLERDTESEINGDTVPQLETLERSDLYRTPYVKHEASAFDHPGQLRRSRRSIHHENAIGLSADERGGGTLARSINSVHHDDSLLTPRTIARLQHDDPADDPDFVGISSTPGSSLGTKSPPWSSKNEQPVSRRHKRDLDDTDLGVDDDTRPVKRQTRLIGTKQSGYLPQKCMIEAFDGAALREALAKMSYFMSRTTRPKLKPWHFTQTIMDTNPDIYPRADDSNEYKVPESCQMFQIEPSRAMNEAMSWVERLYKNVNWTCDTCGEIHNFAFSTTQILFVGCGMMSRDEWVAVWTKLQSWHIIALCRIYQCHEPLHMTSGDRTSVRTRRNCRPRNCRCDEMTDTSRKCIETKNEELIFDTEKKKEFIAQFNAAKDDIFRCPYSHDATDPCSYKLPQPATITKLVLDNAHEQIFIHLKNTHGFSE